MILNKTEILKIITSAKPDPLMYRTENGLVNEQYYHSVSVRAIIDMYDCVESHLKAASDVEFNEAFMTRLLESSRLEVIQKDLRRIAACDLDNHDKFERFAYEGGADLAKKLLLRKIQ